MFGRRRRTADEGPQPPGPGVALRAAVLELSPGEISLAPDPDEVWGVVMDSVFPDGNWFCLVCLADGTTSLYSNGTFGVIGAGEWPQVRAASDVLLGKAAAEVALFQSTIPNDVPPPGFVALRALIGPVQRAIVADEDTLASGSHPASSLFDDAHAVITPMRVAIELGGVGEPRDRGDRR